MIPAIMSSGRCMSRTEIGVNPRPSLQPLRHRLAVYGSEPDIWRVMTSVRVLYREGADEWLVITTEQGIDLLIDDLRKPNAGENMARLFSNERPTLPSGFPDHELCIGVSDRMPVGIVSFCDAEGRLVSRGSPESHQDVQYGFCGDVSEFSAGWEIPIAQVREAAKEFLASGGLRPACLEWQVPEYW